MSAQHSHSNYPKLHNAMWPGLVGKGSPGAEPCIDLDTMLDLTAKAEVDGIKFDGVDLFLFDPHVSIDIDDEGLKRLADKIRSKGFVVGSVVAPVWPPTGGGSAMGSDEERKQFVGQVRKACRIARKLRELGVRPYGVVRIDSASGVADWTKDPEASQKKIARTFNEACDVAEDFGERLAAEGEICWGGMHSWKKMVDLLQRVNRPKTLGFQADMAHTLLYTLGFNAEEDAILPPNWDWSDPQRLNEAMQTLTSALRPWTIDFHVAQNDATVHGSGTHDKTGHHCLPDDPNGKLTIAHHGSGYQTDTGFLYMGNPTGILITAEGRTVYHAGDTGLFLDMQLIGRLNRIDVALLPIGGNFTMDADDAIEAIAMLKPQTVVPMHYDTFDVIHADPAEFTRKAAITGARVKPLRIGESFEF